MVNFGHLRKEFSMTNQIKTVVLLTLIGGLFLMVGYWAGGQAGMTTALVMAVVMNVGAYWFSDKIVLSMHHAQPVDRGHPSGLYEHVRDLAMRAGLPVPKVYIIQDAAPNAFATGRNPQHSAVAVTTGLLDILDERELRGVLAHELAHIQNRDILISTIVAAFAAAIMYLAHMLQWVGLMGGGQDRNRGIHPLAMLATIILAPFVATLIQAAVSRTREFIADETGARIARDPQSLASALQRISDPRLMRQFQRDEAMPDMQPAFSHMYIVNHFAGESILNWFSTHPPVKERIKRLMALRGNL